MWMSTAQVSGRSRRRSVAMATMFSCLLLLLLGSVIPSVQSARAAKQASRLEGKEVVSSDFQQCDRDCRWVYGFYNEDIQGERVTEAGYPSSFGGHCLCTDKGQDVVGKVVKRSLKKDFDQNDF